MEQTPRTETGKAWDQQAIDLAFKEYQLVVEDTARITNNRQAFSNMYTSVINYGFLAGVGYLLLQFIHDSAHTIFYIVGFFAIAFIATNMNRNWLGLSEQNRRLVNLRVRYLEQLESHLRESGAFPSVSVGLNHSEMSKAGDFVRVTRGIFSLEEVLYTSNIKRVPLGFSRAEQRIGNMFTLAYWLVFVFSLLSYALTIIAPYIHH